MTIKNHTRYLTEDVRRFIKACFDAHGVSVVGKEVTVYYSRFRYRSIADPGTTKRPGRRITIWVPKDELLDVQKLGAVADKAARRVVGEKRCPHSPRWARHMTIATRKGSKS